MSGAPTNFVNENLKFFDVVTSTILIKNFFWDAITIVNEMQYL